MVSGWNVVCNEGGIDNVGALFGFGAVRVPSAAVSLPSEVNNTIECEPRATMGRQHSGTKAKVQ